MTGHPQSRQSDSRLPRQKKNGGAQSSVAEAGEGIPRHPRRLLARLPAQTAGAKSGAASHPLPRPQTGVLVETEFRSSAPACDRADFQKSGIRSKTRCRTTSRRSSAAHSDGNVAIATKPPAEDYGGQSGSAYRRSGRFGTPANRPVRRVQRKRRLALPRKKRRRKDARRQQRHPGGWSPTQHRNDARVAARKTAEARSEPICNPRPNNPPRRVFAAWNDARALVFRGGTE